MSFLSNLLKQAAPVVATVAPFVPGGQPIAALASTKVALDRNAAIKYQTELEREKMMRGDFSDFGSSGQRAVVVPPYSPPIATQNAGGGFFSDLGGFFRSAGGVVRDAFGSGIPQLLGVGRPQGVTMQPAVTSVTNIGAQESQGSGTIEAGIGSGLGQLVNIGSRFLRNPAGQIGLGTAIGGGLGLMSSDGRQVRVTRKTKRLAQQAYQLSMGDLGAATSLFAQLSGMSVNEQQYVLILTKRFRNDGAVITKAALRKTRSTIRKMKNMCDMYDDLRPTARRRTPMKRARATTTLIKN